MFDKRNLIYYLILFATCFDPLKSSSGLHYEAINVKKLRTFLGSQQYLQKINISASCPTNILGLCLQNINIRGLCPTNIVGQCLQNINISGSCPTNIVVIPKMYATFQH
jgi:hypothetical protein